MAIVRRMRKSVVHILEREYLPSLPWRIHTAVRGKRDQSSGPHQALGAASPFSPEYLAGGPGRKQTIQLAQVFAMDLGPAARAATDEGCAAAAPGCADQHRDLRKRLLDSGKAIRNDAPAVGR